MKFESAIEKKNQPSHSEEILDNQSDESGTSSAPVKSKYAQSSSKSNIKRNVDEIKKELDDDDSIKSKKNSKIKFEEPSKKKELDGKKEFLDSQTVHVIDEDSLVKTKPGQYSDKSNNTKKRIYKASITNTHDDTMMDKSEQSVNELCYEPLSKLSKFNDEIEKNEIVCLIIDFDYD